MKFTAIEVIISAGDKVKNLIKKILSYSMRRKMLTALNRLWVSVCMLFPVKNRALFYTIRASGRLLDNSRAVYDRLDCPKKTFAAKQPHSKLTKLKAYFLILTSRVIVTDDYCGYLRAVKLRKNQRVFQIWHGCGAFKKFALDSRSDVTPEYERAAHSQYSAVAVSAPACKKVFAGAFGISEEKCVSIGIPMTDYLINNKESLQSEALEKYPFLKGKKIFLYAPTFRETEGKVAPFDPGIDWSSLSEKLAEDEIFIVRRHPIENNRFFERDHKNILDLTEASTIMLCACADVIVTDYSSVVHDAVIIDKPVVFYCPDFRDYERGFYIRYPEDLPGEAVTDPLKLLDVIRKTAKEPPVDRIKRFRTEQLESCDGHSTERAVRLIKSWL